MTRDEFVREAELLRKLYEVSGALLIEQKGDKFVAVVRFAYTFGLCIGMTLDDPYERRYCFELFSDAVEAFHAHSGDDTHAIGPWVKVKGRLGDKWLDDLGPGAVTP